MAIRFPIRKFQGPFEKFVLVTGGRNASIMAARCLEGFFGHFPTAKGLEQFTVADVHEYSAWRLANGTTEASLQRELRCVSRFYQWCIEKKGAKVYNPARPWLEYKKPTMLPRRRISALTIDDFVKLLEVSGPDLRRYLLAVVANRPTVGIFRTTSNLGWQFRRARMRANLNHLTVTKIRKSLRAGFWAEVIRRHCALWAEHYADLKPRDTLPDEPKLLSTPPADIETPPLDVWTPVINSSDDCFAVGWVSDFDYRSEPHVEACNC